ncbi:legumain-like [Amphiura filiformis]|uniref:legumain-like n=1 Tax=Amphiura filiformis TaxID=82378 RepID=UPI003B221E45
MKLISSVLILLTFSIGVAVSLSIVKVRELVAEHNILPKEQEGIKGDADTGKHWALIVAGSNTWYNYRHQADICHAYQILHNHGIPDEQIVVMMYDDIAYNEENPDQGKIINRPNGTNVYPGVPKDYTKEDVTPENFLKVLSGDSEGMSGIGSGKVIASGPNDHVFVYFSDHGAPGLVAFPTDELHANDLLKTLQDMYNNNKYQKLVFYLEACESGSMFTDLPVDIDIYATSAANDHESSYACYYDNHVGTYLGDVYSVMWMEDSDVENLSLETLVDQFRIVKNETNTSHVLEFGDKGMRHDAVGMYQGQGNIKFKPVKLPTVPLNAVPSPEVPMAILHNKLKAAKTEEETTKIMLKIMELQERQHKISNTVEQIVRSVVMEEEAIDRILISRGTAIKTWECYQPVARAFSNKCFKLGQNPHAMTKMHIFVNLCEEGIDGKLITGAMDKYC